MEISFDESFDGLLSAIAYCLRRQIEPDKIECNGQQLSLLEVTAVPRESGVGKLFRRHLASYMGDSSAVSVLETCWQAYLSEEEGICMSIYRYLRLALRCKVNPAPRFHMPDVNRVVAAAQATGFEAHRFHGLLRFRSQQSGLYQADFKPDHNILPLILPHFADRFQDQNFVIRDLRRGLAALHLQDGRWSIFRLSSTNIDSNIVNPQPDSSLVKTMFDNDSPLPGCPCPDEDVDFSILWSKYLRHLTIPERKNKELQRKYLPLKYRKYLPEFTNEQKKEQPRPDAPDNQHIRYDKLT